MAKGKYYYDVQEDLDNYPDAWCYIIIGGRNTGKTYSSLKFCYDNDIKFTFIKRTIEDVKLICTGVNKKNVSIDFSPFKPINRDINSNVKAHEIFKGVGGFWDANEKDEIEGVPIGYITALNAVMKVKGFDLSDTDIMIWDEFIPQPWEKVNRKEGEQAMDLYKTIARDREHRGKKPLKMICLANATRISNPLMNVLEITDAVADMQLKHQSYNYMADRGILIHMIYDNVEFKEKEKDSAIYKAMENTNWGRMALENEFGYDDLTNVGKLKMKNFAPVTSFIYKHKQYYIYQKDGLYYVTFSKHNKKNVYDLALENDQKRFFKDYIWKLQDRCIQGNMVFETYTMYDLIVNYKKIFNI